MSELWESMDRLEKASRSAARHHLLSRICAYMLEKDKDTITAQEIQKIVEEIEEGENKK